MRVGLKSVLSSTVLALGGLLVAAPASSQAQPAAAPAPVKAPVKGAKAPKNAAAPEKPKDTNRLPAHYAGVVNEEQKTKIYAIQNQYDPKIKDLQNQAKTSQQQRDAEIAKLLSPDQAAQVEKAKADAKAKRAKPTPVQAKAPAQPASTTTSPKTPAKAANGK